MTASSAARTRVVFLAASLALPALAVAAEPERSSPVFDLEHCTKTALDKHPSLSLAQEEVWVGDARRRAATVSLFPAVSVKADETRGRADPAAGGAAAPAFVQRSYGVQATQTLFSGGRMWSERRRSALGSEVARLQLEKQKLDVRHAVAEAYWKLAGLEKARAAYQDTCAELQQDVEKAARHELGQSRSARIELLSTRAQSRECELALAEAEENILEARAALLDAMGYVRAAAIEVQTDLPGAEVKADEEEAARQARSSRPELAIAEKLHRSAVLSRRVAVSSFYPRVDLNGFYGRSGAAFIETEPFDYRKDWNAGVRASWPLLGNTLRYSSFKEKTSPKLGESSRTETESQSASLSLGDALGAGVEARESRKALHEEEWRRDKTLRDVEQEARLAARRVRSAWRRAESARSRLEEAQQQYKDTRSLFQDDRAHLGDMAAARNRVAAAQAGRVQALAQYNAAVAGLNRAVGIPDFYRASK
ncbi:MAG: TolC family protein [Elusimicrobiota bacterium]